MDIRKIIAPIGANYLSDIPQYSKVLPDNCLFHKGKTGCGGTTIALKNDLDTIICVPFRSLIFNKLKDSDSYPHAILGVCLSDNGKNTSDSEITEYLRTSTIKKIITTYDSLPRVINVIKEVCPSMLEDFRLIVDEYQVLFKSYDYRYEAARKVLNSLSKFKYVTCMTATPIQREYLFHELKRFRVEEVYWPEEQRTTVQLITTNSIIQAVKQRINVESAKNYHLFINSVKLIASIIKFAGLLPGQTRIICSDSKPTNGMTNNEKLPEGFNVAKITDAVSKYNFYTCCAFEGCDIFDENGETIIVSDAYNANTLLDINTSVPQIIGRIRDSQYRYNITHIYSTLPKSETERMENKLESLRSMMCKTHVFVSDVNQMKEKSSRKTVSELYNAFRYYVNRSDGHEYIYWNRKQEILQCDKPMFLLEIYNISIVKRLYSKPVILSQEYLKNDFNYSANKEYFEPSSIDHNYTKSSFRESFKRYVILKEDHRILYCFTEHEENTIARWFPLIPKAYGILGKSKVESLNYRQADIRKELIKRTCSSNEQAVKEMILESYHYETFISSVDMKEKLQVIYNSLSLGIKPAATQIRRYFDNVQEKYKKKNGKSVRGYIIHECLLPE